MLTLVFIIFFVTLIEIPAVVMLGIWFVLQFLPAIGQLATPDVSATGGGVAYFAHIGGFVFGLAAIKLFANRYRADRRRSMRNAFLLVALVVLRGVRRDDGGRRRRFGLRHLHRRLVPDRAHAHARGVRRAAKPAGGLGARSPPCNFDTDTRSVIHL